MTESFDVNQKLKYYVDEPKAFRKVLGLSQAIIKGSFALHLFHGVERRDVLPIFVRVGQTSRVILDYLKSHGYEVSRTLEHIHTQVVAMVSVPLSLVCSVFV